MNFYVGRPIETLFSEQAIVEWAKQPQPGVLIISEAALAGIEQRRGSLGLVPIASKGDPDFAKGTTIQIAAVLRRGGHP